MKKLERNKKRISNMGCGNMKGDLFERIIIRNRILKTCEKRCSSMDIYEYQYNEFRKRI